MNRHAYLIMAHAQWGQLQKLLNLLDDSRNDVFLHVDANATGFHSEMLSMRYSRLRIVERKPIYWAAYSQTETEVRLLQAATEAGSYAYYHLLSGQDLPLKTQDAIHDFFDNSGKLFIGVVPHEVYYSIRKIKYYHCLLENRFFRKCKLLKGVDRLLEYVQRFLGINRLKGQNWRIYDGWTWFSITDEFARYVVSKSEWIEHHFRHSIASDEIFIPTLALDEPRFRASLYDEHDLKNGSMRFIDWHRGTPYVWGGGNKLHTRYCA